MNKKLFVVAILISVSFLLQGCVSTPEQAGTVTGGTLAGAAIGALAGAAISRDPWAGARRGALGGAAIGGLTGLYAANASKKRGYYNPSSSYYPSVGNIPPHCQSLGDVRSQQICAQAAYQELARQQERARRDADRHAQEVGKSWKY